MRSFAGRATRRIVLLGTALAVPASLAAQQAVVESGAANVELANGQLFWSIGCGDDFSPAVSHVRTQPLSGGAVAMRTLYMPAGCGADRVAPAGIATDGTDVFWVTGDGRVMAIAASAPSRSATRLVAAGSPAAATGAIALGRSDVFWSEGTRVLRAPRSGGDATVIYTGTASDPPVRQLQAADDGRVFILGADRLRALLPLGTTGRYALVPVAGGVTAFRVQPGGAVVYAAG